ncbi:uncharacterized protein LOC128461594 isoform X2 [Pleuronectes platessa]|uniref:uncharacterized protein LOC128461594 isoform X2 n=1 Tax=Pleuronectes platessa TaxID=8262 RepID=UPI00232A48CB|nr:uncharacterized protein LOC128461594 isoform X2 [Pleuronectes platessa]
MKMKMKLLFVSIVIVVMSVPGVTTFIQIPTTTSTTWTTARSVVNLDGKMFTLSSKGGGITFYPSSYTPNSPRTKTTTTTTPRTTTQWTTTPRTTPLSTTGLSVCLRYLTDYMETRNPPLLKLFLSGSDFVTLGTSYNSLYTLSWGYYYTQTFRPNIQFWPGGFSPDIWTRVCVTVDSAKNVGQVFSGHNMSIRKILPYQLPQGNDPVIYVPGFDGQLTDVQMWDYPLSYREIIQYMRPSTYRPSRGSVLTWSDISYSLGGNALLEDTYQMKEQQPISKRGRGRGLRGEKKSRRVFKVEESKKREGGEFQ